MIFRSPHPEVAIPETTVTRFVLQRADELWERTALVDGASGASLTYGELRESIRCAANGMRKRGLEKGDVCAICCPNFPEYAVAFHAVATAGGTSTTMNPLSTIDELVRQLDDSGSRYLITTIQFLDKAREAARISGVEEIFSIGGGRGTVHFDRLLEDDDGMEPDVEIDPARDLVALPYSSGTTGRSRGVMLTHGNLVANMCQVRGIQDMYRISEVDTLVGVLPFYHIYGLLFILNYGLCRGARIVTMARFDLDRFLSILDRFGVTMAHVVPPIVLMLAKDPRIDSYDLNRLRLVNSGGAPLGRDTALAAADRIGCTVVQGYGLTETSPVTHSGLDEPSRYKPDSIGPCIPNTEARVVDWETGKALGANQIGEIWIRGPQVMAGYLNHPEATAEVLDAAGWLHTGDIGYADEDGDFYIVDRLKEIIKYKGYPIAPAEMEEILLSHPRVADAAVIGRADEAAGEVPTAYIVAKDEISEEEIIAYVAERVAPQKKIRIVRFTEEIPRAPSGKILRRSLRERERTNH
jgi:acyl-CoA synthetase (AMP-forming)/AMP-acid ligase II